MANPETWITGNGDQARALVTVFLRGGADGLSLVAPLGDDTYYRLRPRLAVSAGEAVPLDGFFGLNPLMKALEPVCKDKALAVVHAAGSEDQTRSHFEAQDLMEHGGLAAGGWLGRFLRYRDLAGANALSAIALGRELPECLRGAPAATVLNSIDDFSMGKHSQRLTAALGRLYGQESGALGQAGRDTLSALKRIDTLRNTPYQPEHQAEYRDDSFSQGLLQLARLIKSRVGLEAACINLNGWDSHFTQGTMITPLMTRLAEGLAAFYADLGAFRETTTVVVMTEFGRRVRENATFGTDHGRGSVMFVMGGGVRGGRVYGRWPGLTDEVLEGPGDLPVTTNYRDVLAPILSRHGAGDQLGLVFPNHELKPVDMFG